MFIGQSKICSYLNPSKTPGARPPLQEENSVMYHEVKCQGKTLNETNRKGDGKLDIWIIGFTRHSFLLPPLVSELQEARQLPALVAFPVLQLLSANRDSMGVMVSLSFSKPRSWIYGALMEKQISWFLFKGVVVNCGNLSKCSDANTCSK